MTMIITIKELQKLDRQTRKLLTAHRQHHPKADIDCLYVPRKQGGRSLMNLEEVYTAEYKTGGICRQQGRSTNTDCQDTPTQHKLSSVTDI
jgi:hypothetical protein